MNTNPVHVCQRQPAEAMTELACVSLNGEDEWRRKRLRDGCANHIKVLHLDEEVVCILSRNSLPSCTGGQGLETAPGIVAVVH